MARKAEETKATSSPKASGKWGPIKKKLNEFSREGLLALIKDLHDYSPNNRAFLTARFAEAEDSGVVLEEYRQRITKIFFPTRGFAENPNLKEGRKAIREYQKATSDITGTIDLMLTYVEAGTTFTNQYGDLWEAFYASLESVMGEASKLLLKSGDQELYTQFATRLQNLKSATRWIGWGYGDMIADIVDELEEKLGSTA